MARSTLPVRALVAIGTLGIAIGCASKSPSQQPAVPSTPRLEQAGGLAPNLIEVTVRAEKGLTPSPVKTLPPRDPSTIRRDKPHSYRLQSDQTQSFTSGTGTDPAWGGVLVTGNGGWNLNEIAGANWIWRTAAFDNGGAFTVTRTFDIPTGAMNIQGFVEAGFDDSGNVIVNGTDLGRGGDWNTASRMDVSALLHPGSNTVALAGQNGDCASCTTVQQNPAGVDGLVSVTWTGQAALTLSDPASTAPPDTSIAFSPNGDGSKDKISLNVTSPADWQVVVANPQLPGKFITLVKGSGQPTQQSVLWYDTPGNTPNPTVQKNNGTVLKDGVYTLHLTAKGATPGPSDATAIVTIDTVKPIITSETITSIDPIDGSDDSVYTVDVVADDGSGAGIAIGSLMLKSLQPGATATQAAETKLVSANTYELKVRISAPPVGTEEPVLRYDVIAQDNAGNTETSKSKFEETLDLVGTLTVAGASGNDYVGFNQSSASAYSLLGVSASELKAILKAMHFYLFPSAPFANGLTYYAKSEVPFVYGVAYTNIRKKPFQGVVGVHLAFIKQSSGQRFNVPRVMVPVNATVIGSNIGLPTPVDWDPVKAGAREGAYAVQSTVSAWGVRTSIGPSDFKISYAPCVKLGDWKTSSPIPNIPIKTASHILQHILSPSTKPATSIFSHYDNYFNADFPALMPPGGYSDVLDGANGYPIAMELLGRAPLPPVPPPYWAGASTAFDGVYRIGQAVLTPGIGVPPRGASGGINTTAKTAPVVLTNKTVIWVRVAIPPNKGGSIVTVFPDTTSQTAYENSLH